MYKAPEGRVLLVESSSFDDIELAKVPFASVEDVAVHLSENPPDDHVTIAVYDDAGKYIRVEKFS